MQKTRHLTTAATSALILSALALPAIAAAHPTDSPRSNAAAYASQDPMNSSDAMSNERGQFDDAQIAHAVDSQLAANGKTQMLDVTVNAANGVVTLYGTVDTPEQREQVIQIARSVDGVTDVKATSLIVGPTP